MTMVEGGGGDGEKSLSSLLKIAFNLAIIIHWVGKKKVFFLLSRFMMELNFAVQKLIKTVDEINKLHHRSNITMVYFYVI